MKPNLCCNSSWYTSRIYAKMSILNYITMWHSTISSFSCLIHTLSWTYLYIFVEVSPLFVFDKHFVRAKLIRLLNGKIKKMEVADWRVLSDYMMTHLPFSAHGLFFLSGAWIRGSFFSFSSTYSRILKKEKLISQNLYNNIIKINYTVCIKVSYVV